MGYRIDGNRIYSDEEWREVIRKRGADAEADLKLFAKILRCFIHYCLLSVIIYVQFLQIQFVDEGEILNLLFQINKLSIVLMVVSLIHLFLNKWFSRIINAGLIVYIYFFICKAM